MRTKTLLLAAAALAAGILSSNAQTVYSANIVGYVNLSVTPGQYSLLSAPLDVDGSGTNSTITSVVGTNVASGTTVLVFNGSSYDTLLFAPLTRGGSPVWNVNGTATPGYPLNPGEGFWIQDPSDTNITQAGIVLTGTVTNKYLGGAGLYSLVSSPIPLAGGLTTALNYQPNSGDTVFLYNGSGYDTYIYAPLTRGGLPVWNVNGVASEPQIKVGQGFWIQPAANNTWSMTLTNN